MAGADQSLHTGPLCEGRIGDAVSASFKPPGKALAGIGGLDGEIVPALALRHWPALLDRATGPERYGPVGRGAVLRIANADRHRVRRLERQHQLLPRRVVPQ